MYYFHLHYFKIHSIFKIIHRRRKECKFRHITYAQFKEEKGYMDKGFENRVHNLSHNNPVFNGFHDESITLGSSWRHSNGRSVRPEKTNSRYINYKLDTNEINSHNGTLYQMQDGSNYDSCSDSRVIRNDYTITSAGYNTYEPPTKKRFYEDKTSAFYNRYTFLSAITFLNFIIMFHSRLVSKIFYKNHICIFICNRFHLFSEF